MDYSNRNSQKQVTLQDLLKVKRLEKPDEAFWEKFDHELSQRTLKKLVYKPSIFSQIKSLASSFLKPAVPLGALSALTIATFLYSYLPKFSSSNSIICQIPSYDNENLMDFTSAKKNYVKANIILDIPQTAINSNVMDYPSASGIRFLAGSLNGSGLVTGQGIAKNNIY